MTPEEKFGTEGLAFEDVLLAIEQHAMDLPDVIFDGVVDGRAVLQHQVRDRRSQIETLGAHGARVTGVGFG